MKDNELNRIANALERIADVLEKGTLFVAEDKHVLQNGTGATLRQLQKNAVKITNNIVE